MLIKKTAKNQVTLAKALLDQIPPTDHFEAEVLNGALVLRPVRIVPLIDIDKIRARLKRSRVQPEEVQRAVAWARDKT